MRLSDSPQLDDQLANPRQRGTANRAAGTHTIRILLTLRLLFLCELLIFVHTNDWANLFFYGAIFVGSLVVPLLGRFDPEYYRLDIFAMLVFSMGPLVTSFGGWPAPVDMHNMLLGVDKPLHLAGGACLAMFAAVALRKHISSASLFYTLLVVCALALGAAWEIFEWATSLLPRPFRLLSSGYEDSMLDMVADALGAAIAAAVLKARGYHRRSR